MIGPAGDFHFLRPAALLLLVLVPVVLLGWRRSRGGGGAWRGVVDARLLPHLLGPGTARRSHGGAWLAGLAGVVAVLALAGPAWEREPLPLYRNQAARVIVLELARSMLASDIKPSRLERARYKIDAILTRSRDYQTALVGYAGDAFVAAPLTDDVATVRNLVAALEPDTMPVDGNDTARGIQVAVDLIRQAGLRHGGIVVLADSVGADADAAARAAREAGITVSVLGVGSDAGAPVPLAGGGFLDQGGQLVLARRDEAGLRSLADAGGGRYAALTTDAGDLDTLLAATVEGAERGDADGTAESARWRDRGPWLLLGLVPLVLAGFRRGWLLVLVAAVALPTGGARAAGWRDLWQRPDQQAARALAEGDAARAATLASDPQWRASALYRAGDFAAALDGWQAPDSADAAYNRGNALARLGRLEQALEAYDQALELAPGMEDALANRALVEQALQQQAGESGPADASQDGEPQQGDDPAAGDGSSQDQAGSQPSPSSGSDDGREGAEGAGEGDHRSDADPPEGEGGVGAAGGNDAPLDGEATTQPDAAQQEALADSIDQALADAADDAGSDATTVGAAPEDAAASEKRQALDHLLQRVPDDPGGLLRRKFQLEYQRRQRGGDTPP